MNGDFEMIEAFNDELSDITKAVAHVDWLLCPPYPYIAGIDTISRGAQDCSAQDNGAHTGEISASMLSDIGCEYCIAGHSERREYYGESNADVKAKANKVIENNMIAIICVGETLTQRQLGAEYKVVEAQIVESLPSAANAQNVVIAYEPVWAIGTGQAATVDDVLKMHTHIRELLKTTLADGAKMRILYGGSVKPSNASELMNLDNVDGALIGGASLKSADFIAIGKAVKN